MQDLQNYQYYDPSPQPAPLVWWRRRQALIRLGLGSLMALVLILVTVAIVNVVKNRQLANRGVDLMVKADEIESQLGSACSADDAACLELARADAARSLGVSQACDELIGESLASCVTLIAIDKQDPEVCKALSGEDKTTCADSAYLLKANAEMNLALCDQINAGSLKSTCSVQVANKLVTAGRCAEAGVDQGVCDLATTVATAIATGDPAVCATLVDELDQYNCNRGITSLDEDDDGLVLADEVSRGLSDTVADSDGDGLLDGDEVDIYKTDPAKSDTDGDGYSDGTEVAKGYDPLH